MPVFQHELNSFNVILRLTKGSYKCLEGCGVIPILRYILCNI